MGALPKKKISRARRGNRRRHIFLTPPQLMDCPQCGSRKVTHRVCLTCGMYNGNQILTIREKQREAE